MIVLPEICVMLVGLAVVVDFVVVVVAVVTVVVVVTVVDDVVAEVVVVVVVGSVAGMCVQPLNSATHTISALV